MISTAAIPSEALSVDPGSSVALDILVTNGGVTNGGVTSGGLASGGAIAETVELVLEGIDPEWIAVPQPTLALDPGASGKILVLFRPPRSSESAAGDYPFVARVRAVTGEPGERALSGILRVRPYHHLALEISPKKGAVSAARRANTFDVTVLNLGNADHSLQLSGSDPEDECAYEFDHENLGVGPGQSREVAVTVNPRSRKALSSSRLIGFGITARSVETPSVVATTQAQLEVKPFLTPATLAFLLFAGSLLGLLWFFQPKPPRVTSLTVDRPSAQRGERVTVSWRTTDASGVRLRVGGEEIPGALPAEGTREIELTNVGTEDVVATALRDQRQSDPQSVTIAVTAPVPVPEPKITKLEPSARSVRVGQSFVLKYGFNAAVTSAKISPLAKDLDLALDAIQIPTDTPGTIEYTVVAENKAGKRVTKSFKVEVTDPSEASVVDFAATPKTVEPNGTVTVSWTVTGAAAIRLSYAGRDEDLATGSGTRTISVAAKTTFTLRATDGRGKSVSRSVTVRVKAPPPVVVEPANDANGTNDPVLPEDAPNDPTNAGNAPR